MSVFAYTGLPGSGKTYSVVEHQIFPALRAGRVVCTNVPLKFDLVRDQFPNCDIRQVSLDAWLAEPDRVEGECPPGAVVVLDEVWRLWPSGARADKIPEAFRSFLAEHRHRMNAKGDSQQIVLVTQDLKQIAAFARQQVESTFRTVKLSALGASKRFRVDVFQGPAEGPNPPSSMRLRQILGRYDPKVFGFYVSHTMSEAGEGAAVNESAMDGRANVWKRPLLMISPVVILGLLFGGFYGLHHGSLAAHAVGGSGVAGASELVPAGGVAGGLLGRSDGSARRAVATWRVVGRLEGACWAGGCGWAMLEDGTRGAWVPLFKCRQVGPVWQCPAPDGSTADDADLPVRPSVAVGSSLAGRLER